MKNRPKGKLKGVVEVNSVALCERPSIYGTSISMIFGEESEART